MVVWVMCLNMTATVDRRGRLRFSETALCGWGGDGTAWRADRGAERLLQAGRDVLWRARRLGALAVGRGGLADHGAEGAAEGPEAGEADVKADLGDRGDVGDAGEGDDVERRGEGAVDRVAGAQHP